MPPADTRGNAPQEPTADLEDDSETQGSREGRDLGRPPHRTPIGEKEEGQSDRPTPEKDQRPKPGEQRGQDQKNGGSQEQHWLAQQPGQLRGSCRPEAQADPMEVRPHNLHHPQMLTQPCPQPPPHTPGMNLPTPPRYPTRALMDHQVPRPIPQNNTFSHHQMC
jgi:hypothetical protein